MSEANPEPLDELIPEPVPTEAPEGEAPPAVSPPAEQPPESSPESAPAPRTLLDIHNDYLSGKALLPHEYEQYQQARADHQKQVEAARAEEERIQKLFPTVKSKVVKDLADWLGTAEGTNDHLALQQKLAPHWEELERDAKTAIRQPLMRTIGSQLWELTGKSRDAHGVISSLSDEQIVPFAYELGRRSSTGPADLASEAEVSKWLEDGKLDAKKYITVEQADKRVAKALEVERAANPGRSGPGPTGRSTPIPNELTLEQALNLPTDQLREYRARRQAAG